MRLSVAASVPYPVESCHVVLEASSVGCDPCDTRLCSCEGAGNTGRRLKEKGLTTCHGACLLVVGHYSETDPRKGPALGMKTKTGGRAMGGESCSRTYRSANCRAPLILRCEVKRESIVVRYTLCFRVVGSAGLGQDQDCSRHGSHPTYFVLSMRSHRPSPCYHAMLLLRASIELARTSW